MVGPSKSLIKCPRYLTVGEIEMGVPYRETLGHGACLRVKVVWNMDRFALINFKTP